MTRVEPLCGALLDPMHLEIGAQSAADVAPNTWIQAVVRLAQHFGIPMEAPVLARSEDENDVVYVSQCLLELLGVATSRGPDALCNGELHIPQVHGAHDEEAALPMDGGWQSWDCPLL